MAKRKRLTPANPPAVPAGLETKAMFPPGAGRIKAAPIADVAQDSAASAALQEVSDTLRQARETGRMVLDLPLAVIDERHLVRDRTRIDEEELAALRSSIAARGQQTPIEAGIFHDSGTKDKTKHQRALVSEV